MLMLMAENLLRVMSAPVLLVGSHAVYKHRQLFLADIASCHMLLHGLAETVIKKSLFLSLVGQENALVYFELD